jgi:hypothetical protein
VIDQAYVARHVATLLKLARSTSDRMLAAALIDKAVELKSRLDDPQDREPNPPNMKAPGVLHDDHAYTDGDRRNVRRPLPDRQ